MATRSWRTLATFAAGAAAGAVLVGALWMGEQTGKAATASGQPFRDVPSSHWAAPAVNDLAAKGIVQPTPSGRYDGNRYVTRYEVAVLLDRFVHYVENGRKPLHATLIDPKKMPNIPQGTAHDSLVFLVRNRYITPSNLLLQQPGTAPIKASQMSEVMAEVVKRIADRNVAPNPDGEIPGS